MKLFTLSYDLSFLPVVFQTYQELHNHPNQQNQQNLYCWQSLKQAKKMVLLPDKLYVYNWLREGSITSKFFTEKSMLLY